MQKIHDIQLCYRFSLIFNSINLLPNFFFLKSTLYLFPGLIWPKVEPLDPSGVIKWLAKSAWFWCKMAVGSSFLSTGSTISKHLNPEC